MQSTILRRIIDILKEAPRALNRMTTTGMIAFAHGDEIFQTWYKVVGDLKAGVRPLVTLHGGPGMSHHYMIPHADLSTSHNVPVIFYDQVGAGDSSHSPQKPPEFWTVDLFMDELDNLLNHFGIRDDFDLLGHSWGGMFAGQYAAVRHPKGLKHLVIVNAAASMELWVKSTNRLLEGLPKDVGETLKRHEREGTWDSKEYTDAMQVFNQKNICNLTPWPEELLESFRATEEDPTVYSTMVGHSEFVIAGTLKSWSIVDQIQNITSSTLLVTAHEEEMQEPGMMPFFRKIEKVKWVSLAGTTHIPMYEKRERYLQVIGDFLETIS